ncbi:MAG: caspase family protein, partial [Cyanobacteria bacterium P01_D01_bin.105]
TEVLKVFAAIGPADFSSLELSPLDVPMASKSAATRSAGETGSLNRLMSAINAESPKLTRAAVAVADPNQDWTTKQIRFTLTQA